MSTDEIDSRLFARPGRRAGTVHSPAGNLEPVYCANCGTPGGYVIEEYTSFIMYLCPPCATKYGDLPLPIVDEDEIRGKKGIS